MGLSFQGFRILWPLPLQVGVGGLPRLGQRAPARGRLKQKIPRTDSGPVQGWWLMTTQPGEVKRRNPGARGSGFLPTAVALTSPADAVDDRNAAISKPRVWPHHILEPVAPAVKDDRIPAASHQRADDSLPLLTKQRPSGLTNTKRPVIRGDDSAVADGRIRRLGTSGARQARAAGFGDPHGIQNEDVRRSRRKARPVRSAFHAGVDDGKQDRGDDIDPGTSLWLHFRSPTACAQISSPCTIRDTARPSSPLMRTKLASKAVNNAAFSARPSAVSENA